MSSVPATSLSGGLHKPNPGSLASLENPASPASPGSPADSASRWAQLAGKLRAGISQRLGYALADQVVYSIGNMVVAAMLSRHCRQREFGIYILTQRTMDVLIQLCNVFLWGPFTFNLPATPQDRRGTYQGSIFGLQTIFCVVFSLALWVASHWASIPSRGIYYGTFAPLVITGGGILFREFTRRMYFSHMRLKEAFWTDLATVVLQIAGVEWLYLAGRLDVTHTLLVLCFGAVAVSFWWLFCEWNSFRVEAAASWLDLKMNMQLGRWFLGSNMVFLASSQCNPWVLSALLGGSAVGAYAVCESVVNIPRVALTSMQNVMGPMIARARNEGGRAELGAMVRRLDRNLLIGSVVFALGILAVGPWVAQLIFKASPANARLLLAFLAVNLVAYAATLAQSYGLTALGRADTTFYANALGLLVQASVCFYLVRSLQVPGAAAAMLLGSVVVLGVRGLFFQREMARA